MNWRCKIVNDFYTFCVVCVVLFFLFRMVKDFEIL